MHVQQARIPACSRTGVYLVHPITVWVPRLLEVRSDIAAIRLYPSFCDAHRRMDTILIRGCGDFTGLSGTVGEDADVAPSTCSGLQ
eukprot:2649478-Pyramimonas_sp.AAC.2